MIIALGCPAYKQTMCVQSAVCWSQDHATALELGWKPAHIWVDNSGIARARNVIVDQSTKLGARLLLMMDSDSFADVPQGGLSSMWAAMQGHDAAAVGAAFVVRNDNMRINVDPVKPGEVYEGAAGAAYLLIDMWKLRDLPRPWFRHQDSDDGLEVTCGEDVFFARHVKEHGHRFVVNFAIPTGHAMNYVAHTAK